MSDRLSGAGRDCESASKNFCMSRDKRIVVWRWSFLQRSPALSAGAPDEQSRLRVRGEVNGGASASRSIVQPAGTIGILPTRRLRS
jgi:hypothetical protein